MIRVEVRVRAKHVMAQRYKCIVTVYCDCWATTAYTVWPDFDVTDDGNVGYCEHDTYKSNLVTAIKMWFNELNIDYENQIVTGALDKPMWHFLTDMGFIGIKVTTEFPSLS